MIDGDGEKWVDLRVDAACESAPADNATVTTLKGMIREAMANRLLATGEQTRLARQLLATLSGGGK